MPRSTKEHIAKCNKDAQNRVKYHQIVQPSPVAVTGGEGVLFAGEARGQVHWCDRCEAAGSGNPKSEGQLCAGGN